MLPTREKAIELISEGLACNPELWGKHCLTAAHCAEKIAEACGDMDSEKAYVLGLLHDIGRKFDVSKEELTLIKHELDKVIFDEYDKLIQLCDCLAGTNGVLDIEMRMSDVKRRYGFYPQQKWDSNIRLMHYFEGKINKSIYIVCEKDKFVPENISV